MISDLVHGPICSSSNFILVLTGLIESILGGDKYIITIGRPAKPISPGKIPPNAQSDQPKSNSKISKAAFETKGS